MKGLTWSPGHPTLTYLTLNGNGVTEAGLEAFAKCIPQATSLQSLNLLGCAMSAKCFDMLHTAVQAAPHLRSLVLLTKKVR